MNGSPTDWFSGQIISRQSDESDMARNDDELEANWAAEAVAVSDDESVVSAGSEDEFEDEQDLELAPAKRSRDEMESGAVGDDAAMDDDADEDAAAVPEKKQKMENAVCP